MKTRLITIISAIALLPITGFTQPPPNPPTPPNPPGPPPGGGGPGDRHEERERREKMPKVPVTFLGVDTSEVPRVVSEQLGLPKGFGLVVDYVVPDSPAAAGGVQQNDILRMLNDQILTEPEQLSKLIRSYSDGTSVTLTVLRKGKEEKLTVKLSKKEVPQRPEFGPGRHGHEFPFGDHDFGMNDLRHQMRDLGKQLGEEQRDMIRDAVTRAHEQATQAREEGRRAAAEGLRAATEGRRAAQAAINGAGQLMLRRDGSNGLQTTKIDIGKAQIVFSDDKGELRIENIDGKKVLTAKDPKGLLLFSGPIETKEEMDKVPADVRQRFDQLQQNALPAVGSTNDQNEETEESADTSDDNDDEEVISTEQVSTQIAPATGIAL